MRDASLISDPREWHPVLPRMMLGRYRKRARSPPGECSQASPESPGFWTGSCTRKQRFGRSKAVDPQNVDPNMMGPSCQMTPHQLLCIFQKYHQRGLTSPTVAPSNHSPPFRYRRGERRRLRFYHGLSSHTMDVVQAMLSIPLHVAPFLSLSRNLLSPVPYKVS
jgi:hypothetical protein